MLEEFEALGMPHDHRGARADEMLEIYRTLFTEPQPAHEGRFYRFQAVGFEPQPVRGTIPVWVGGNTLHAHRRAARHRDSLYPVFSPPEVVPSELSLALRMRLRLDRETEDSGALSGSTD